MPPSPPRIPLLDPQPELDEHWDDLVNAATSVLRSGRYILGPEVRAFEEEIAAYLGCRHAVGVNSGTDALVIALRALGMGSGDEVITTPFTFFATAEAIAQVGAVPVFADIDPVTFNIDPSEVERRVTEATKAVMPVHLFGQPAAMSEIGAVARRHGLAVVEDAAQAFGADVDGRKVGTVGDAGAFSFFPTKPLAACGDGGAIVTDDDAIAEQARMLRVHGARTKYFNETLGYNSRLDELQAAILRVRLPHIDEANRLRRRAASAYAEALADIPGIVLPAAAATDSGDHIFHQYTIRILDGRRDDVRRRLDASGIETFVYYPVPLHRLPPFDQAGPPSPPSPSPLPQAEQAAREVLSFPFWPRITPEVIDTVATTLRSSLALAV